MVTQKDYLRCKNYAIDQFAKSQIILTEKEKEQIEVADMGLGRIEEFGLLVVTYVNTQRCCAKELVLMPGQICPEHKHPPVLGEPGKEETFRCRFGEVYLYVEGEPTEPILAKIPEDKKDYLNVRHQIVLKPGEQYTMMPNTLHWFQGGPQGCVVSEFSTCSKDELDIFTDPTIVRAPAIEQ